MHSTMSRLPTRTGFEEVENGAGKVSPSEVSCQFSEVGVQTRMKTAQDDDKLASSSDAI